MANQITINIGAAANDGTGDPLRTAFNDVNLNFANVWNTGLPNSNVQFSDNRILTVNTNANLVLSPNGIGKVVSNVDIVPSTSNVFNFGGSTRRWNSVYSQSIYVDNYYYGNGTPFSGGSGGNYSNVNVAAYLASGTNTSNIVTSGNISAGHFIGNGSLLTGIVATSSYGNSNVAAYLPTYTGNILAGNIRVSNVVSTGEIYGRTGTFTGDQYSDGAIYVGTPAGTVLGSDVVMQITANAGSYSQTNFQNINTGGAASSDYILTADNGNNTTHFLDMGITSSGWDGSETNVLSGLTTNNGYLYVQDGNLTLGTRAGNVSYSWKFDTTGNLTVAGNVVPTGNNTQSLGSATRQWNDLYLSNATIYMNSVPISLAAGNVLTVDGADVVTTAANGITQIGNVTFDNQIVIGTGDSGGFGGLYLAPGNTEQLVNSGYFRVRGGDVATHLHFDTGNNTYFDQYFGDDNKFVKLDAGEYGNVTIGTYNPGESYGWTFDNLGALNLPLTALGASDQIKYGTGNLIVWNDGGWALGVYDGNDVGTEGMRLSPGVEGNVEVILPANQDAATNPLGLNNYAGNVQVNANNHYWTFGADGTTTFPADTIAQTTNANLEIQTASGGSLVFSRASGGSYLQTSDPIAFNGQPWSFETYVYLEDTGKNILAGVDTLPGLNIYFDGTTFNVQSDDVLINTWSNVVPTLNAWHHIAVGYNGEGINAWLDGAQLTDGQQTTAAAGGDYGNNVLYVGATPWDESAGSAMRITNLRIVAGGTTLYDPNATTITVPQPKLELVEGTQLLLLANTEATAYDDSTGDYGITPTRMTWSSSTPSVTAGVNNWSFSNQGNLYLPNNGVIASSGNNIVITNATLLEGDITIEANASVNIRGGDSDAPNTYGGWVYISGGSGGPDSGVGVGGGGSVEISAGFGANAISDAAGEGGELRLTGGAGGTANAANSITAGNGGVVYIFGGQAGDVDGDNNLAVNGPPVEIHGGLGSFNNTTMVGRPGDVLTQGGGNGWIGASGNVYSKTSPDGYGFYTWGYINNGQTLYPVQNIQRGDNPSGTISGYALVGGAGDNEFIISTPDGIAGYDDSQRLVINPGKGRDGTNGEGGDIYLWAGRGGSGDEANAVSAGSGGDIKIRGGQGGGWNGDGGYIRIEAGDASSTGGASGYIDITGGNSAVSTGGRVAITGGEGTSGGDANIIGGYGRGGVGGNVNIIGGSSDQGAGSFGNVIINTGNTWTFDRTGNLTIPSGVKLVSGYPGQGAIANTAALAGDQVYLSSTDGNAWIGIENGTPIIGSDPTTYWSFGATGNLTTPGSGGDITMTGGNIVSANVVTANTFVGSGGNLTDVATTVTGGWLLNTGTNAANIEVPLNGTYSIWINGNIPNGIAVWNATVTVTNNNVPVIGQQFAWNYVAGNALVIKSIPSQIIGTAGAISNAAPSVGTTTNVFEFSIDNNSGDPAVVNWGYTKLG